MGQETLKKTTGSQDKGGMPEAMKEEPLAGPGVALIPDVQNSTQKSRAVSSMSGSQVA
jgi:hypothetical protein